MVSRVSFLLLYSAISPTCLRLYLSEGFNSWQLLSTSTAAVYVFTMFYHKHFYWYNAKWHFFLKLLYIVDSPPVVLLPSQIFSHFVCWYPDLWQCLVLEYICCVISFLPISLNCQVHAKPNLVLQNTCAVLISCNSGNVATFGWSKLKRRTFRQNCENFQVLVIAGTPAGQSFIFLYFYLNCLMFSLFYWNMG